jgi:hypothetical protein
MDMSGILEMFCETSLGKNIGYVTSARHQQHSRRNTENNSSFILQADTGLSDIMGDIVGMS